MRENERERERAEEDSGPPDDVGLMVDPVG